MLLGKKKNLHAKAANKGIMQIYVVSCDKGRADRFLACASPLKIDFRMIQGLVPTDDEFISFEPRFLKTQRAGDVACTLSHVRAMKAFLETGDDVAAIVEDDVRFHKDFNTKIAILETLVRTGGMDVLSFGFCSDCCGYMEPIEGDMAIMRDSKVGNPWGTQGYILTREFASRLVGIVSSPNVYDGMDGNMVADCSILGPAVGCNRVSLYMPIAIEDLTEQSFIGNWKQPLQVPATTNDYYMTPPKNGMKIYAVNCDKGRAERLFASAAPLNLNMVLVPSPLWNDEEVLRRGKTCFDRKTAYPTGFAATIGHMRAMQLLIDSGEPMAMIIEDDVRFHKDYHRICAIVAENMHDADVFTTGYVNFPEGVEEGMGGLKIIKNVELGNPWGAQGYVITADYAKRFLKIFEEEDVSGPYTYTFVTDCVIFDPVLGCRRHTLVDPIMVEDPDEQTIAGNYDKPKLFERLKREDYCF
jgi:GR25 family glycosyltransferase involved in LPS biosynthesis